MQTTNKLFRQICFLLYATRHHVALVFKNWRRERCDLPRRSGAAAVRRGARACKCKNTPRILVGPREAPGATSCHRRWWKCVKIHIFTNSCFSFFSGLIFWGGEPRPQTFPRASRSRDFLIQPCLTTLRVRSSAAAPSTSSEDGTEYSCETHCSVVSVRLQAQSDACLRHTRTKNRNNFSFAPNADDVNSLWWGLIMNASPS